MADYVYDGKSYYMSGAQNLQKTRFLFVDGLRGIAALLVVFYHFNGALVEVSQRWAAEVFNVVFKYGYLGVDVFFVISGFVIPYSVSRFKPTFRFLGRFALRRSIRLDPPYWLTIFAELFVVFLTIKYFSAFSSRSALPDFFTITSHFFYAQDILGYGNISPVFWTLCLEVQFYLFFVLSLISAAKLERAIGKVASNVAIHVLAGSIFIYSVLLFYGPLESLIAGSFVPRWFQFFLGFLAMRSVQKEALGSELVVALFIVMAASALNTSGADNGIVSVISAGLLVFAGIKRKMGTWLSSRPLQFLGRISYSLYLIHGVVGWRLIKLTSIRLGSDPSLSTLIGLFVLGVATAIFAAWVMYSLVEKPSLKVCHSISLDKPINMTNLRDTVFKQVGWVTRNS